MHCSGCFQDAILIASGENNFNGFRSLKLTFVLVVIHLYTLARQSLSVPSAFKVKFTCSRPTSTENLGLLSCN